MIHTMFIESEINKNLKLQNILHNYKSDSIQNKNFIIVKEDKEPFKSNDIILDYSTKDSEDKDKDKEKTFLKLKRRRYDENDNDYKNISYIQK